MSGPGGGGELEICFSHWGSREEAPEWGLEDGRPPRKGRHPRAWASAARTGFARVGESWGPPSPRGRGPDRSQGPEGGGGAGTCLAFSLHHLHAGPEEAPRDQQGTPAHTCPRGPLPLTPTQPPRGSRGPSKVTPGAKAEAGGTGEEERAATGGEGSCAAHLVVVQLLLREDGLLVPHGARPPGAASLRGRPAPCASRRAVPWRGVACRGRGVVGDRRGRWAGRGGA